MSPVGEWVEGKMTKIQSLLGSIWSTYASCTLYSIRVNAFSASAAKCQRSGVWEQQK